MPSIPSTKSHLRSLAVQDERAYTSVEQPLKKDTLLTSLSTHDIKWSRQSPEPSKLPYERQLIPMSTTREKFPMSSLEFLFPIPPSKSADTPRSPILPPYSSVAPSRSSPAQDLRRYANSEFAERPISTIRRTQSAADIRSTAQWKPLPARPLECERKQNETDESKQSGCRPTRPLEEDIRTSTKVNNLSKELTKEHPERKERSSAKSQLTMNQDRNENTPSDSLGVEIKGQGSRRRLTKEQILWLHRNYRGEATFLKAWGLHVTRDADRERGLEIIRVLMAAESTEERRRPWNQGKETF
ncbi:hypothetical protein F4774DRAFT_420500 [Daldinia eschscholtzii]|nr:hypothetical protein F4774DRAFT_420500 [Daldinia eschscholtzii]